MAEALDGYGKNGKSDKKERSEIDEDGDMFADLDEGGADADVEDMPGKGKKKSVRFMEADEIEGQVENSKSGGHVSANFALDPKG